MRGLEIRLKTRNSSNFPVVRTGKSDGKVETENPSLTEFISRRVSRVRRVSRLKADFQSSHEAPRSSLRVHA